MKITKKEFIENKEFYFNEIKRGKIFIYPTDTIYGVGCDASNSNAVKKIREIKKRDEKPFSIIVPDKTWIFENCYVKERDKEFIDKLPGNYTLIFKIKKDSGIAKNELVGNRESIGIRIPDNWFAEILSKTKATFVTTSVNLSGEKHVTDLNDLGSEISKQVDYMIDQGALENNPSKVIDLSGECVKVIR